MNEDPKLRKYEVDGIKEYDHPLPRWWVGLFILTVIFGIGYFAYYQIGHGPTLTDEMNRALELEKSVEKNLATSPSSSPQKDSTFDLSILTDAQRIEEGKGLFNTTCAPCHGSDGGGVIGPNLTDDHWIHGCTKEAIFKTIKNGVLEKGMAAWGQVFDDDKIRSITAYILTLTGTTPQNPKAKEGVFCDVKASQNQGQP